MQILHPVDVGTAIVLPAGDESSPYKFDEKMIVLCNTPGTEFLSAYLDFQNGILNVEADTLLGICFLKYTHFTKLKCKKGIHFCA